MPRFSIESADEDARIGEGILGADRTGAGNGALRALPSLCPYLATPDGSWRSARAVPEHRCMAVTPPVPVAAEKQRRLCLVDAHTSCATYGAAKAARAEPIERLSGRARPIARMTPVILDQGRFAVRVPSWRTDRTSQGVLVGILGVAFAAILVARPADPAGAGPFVIDPSATSSANLAPSDPVGAEPTDPPATQTEPSPSTDSPGDTEPSEAPASAGAQASPGSPASAEPVTSGATYRVKSGDTLSAIAGRFGTTTQVLVRLNDIADPSKLKIGQILKLP